MSELTGGNILLPAAQPADPGTSPNLENASRAEFINALVHLYRGQLGESSAWRSRIDATTNWAVVLSATALSFVFSGSEPERHILIPIVSLFCTFFLFIEARRYRFYDIWRTRARLIEMNFYRTLLDGSQPPLPQWNVVLSQDLEWPRFHMTLWEAVGRRLRRNYQWIYAILFGCWMLVLLSHPTVAGSFMEIIRRASVGPVPGSVVFGAMLIFYGFLIALGIGSYVRSRNQQNLPAGHPGRLAQKHPGKL